MSVKVEEGFCQAQSDNLPKVDSLMVAEFFSKNDCFSASEIRGVKEDRVSRESYGDSAIGYVQIKRVQNLCIVKCKICPEHRVTAKNYNVIMEMDEVKEKIIKVECLDCAAAAGGCKHSVAFLMWVHRRSEEPSPTDVQCYWKKSELSKVGTTVKFLTVAAFGGVPVERQQNSFLEDAVAVGVQAKAASELFKFYSEPKFKPLNLWHLLLQFVEHEQHHIYKNFKEFCRQTMSDDLCNEAALCCTSQSEDSLWHCLRFGRVTASKLYSAAHCKSNNGTFVQQVIGVLKVRDTKAMERGRRLEKEVLNVLETNFNYKFSYVGIVLSQENPIFGASPDAVCDDHVVEVKCPTSHKTASNYITRDNKITAKYRAQVQLQMHILKKKRCIFAVADPDFEKNRKISSISVAYDRDYVQKMMCDAEVFWEKNVFPKLLQSAKK